MSNTTKHRLFQIEWMSVSAGTPRTSFFPPDASSVSPSSVRLLCTELCRTNVINGAAWVGCQSQRATAHCRFYRRDELPLSLQERRLKDTMVHCPHILSRSPSLCFFFFFFFLQTSNFLTFLFSKSVHLR